MLSAVKIDHIMHLVGGDEHREEKNGTAFAMGNTDGHAPPQAETQEAAIQQILYTQNWISEKANRNHYISKYIRVH